MKNFINDSVDYGMFKALKIALVFLLFLIGIVALIIFLGLSEGKIFGGFGEDEYLIETIGDINDMMLDKGIKLEGYHVENGVVVPDAK